MNGDTRVHTALPIALQLVGAVRDGNAQAVQAAVDRADIPALVVTLAAMVDDSRPLSDLMAWTYDVQLMPACRADLDHSPTGSTAVHGTRSRYSAGCRGDACRRAESVYQHERYLRRVAS